MSEERLQFLFQLYLDKTCTAAEREELFGLSLEAGMQDSLKRIIGDAWTLTKEEEGLADQPAKIMLEKILEGSVQDDSFSDSKVIPFTKKRSNIYRRIAVAASVVGLLLVGGYWLVKSRESGVRSRESSVVSNSHDVKAPTVARATLKLDDGRIVYLDSVGNGQLAMQGNVSVVKSADGKLVYSQGSTLRHFDKLSAQGDNEIKYNTIINPRGSRVQALTLIDGTQVWLNAASSITYPTAFVGNERKVTMTGEAYFEVKHDATKKFIVDANGTTTEVLGTHFNVNAYDDEDAVRVTLLQGSVKVSKSNGSNESLVIRPGEQAKAVNGELSKVNEVTVEEVMAWKNGKFYFDEADMQAIMRQVARWYDVEIVYDGSIPAGHYNGKPSRDLSLAEMLKIVQYSGVKIKIEGKKVTVKQ